MRIIAISDTHNNYPALPDGDILIHCGDLTAKGSYPELFKAIGWLQRQTHKHKILVPGNHDFDLLKPHIPVGLSGIHFLIDREIRVEGLRIYGTPWLYFEGWATHKGTRELDAVYEKVPPGLDILVTHSPAFGILDACRDGHVGVKALLAAVEAKRPKLHIFGHVHEMYGTLEGPYTKHINCAWVGVTQDGKSKPPNPPVVIDL